MIEKDFDFGQPLDVNPSLGPKSALNVEELEKEMLGLNTQSASKTAIIDASQLEAEMLAEVASTPSMP